MSALDMDVGAALKKLFSRGEKSQEGAKADRAVGEGGGEQLSQAKRFTLPVALGIGVLALAAFLYFYYLPQHQRVQEMRNKVEQLPQISREISALSLALSKAQLKLTEAQRRYDELTHLFHTEQELEELYRHISTIALTNGLTITGINRQKEVPVYEQGKAGASAKGKPAQPEVAYYRVPMKVDFAGPYLNYVRFRASLAAIKKLVNIDFESVRLVTTPEGTGGVNINAVISTYRMPERYLNLETKP